jgi:hypothetical protein
MTNLLFLGLRNMENRTYCERVSRVGRQRDRNSKTCRQSQFLHAVVPASNNTDILHFANKVEVGHELLSNHVLGAVAECGSVAQVQSSIGTLLELSVEELTGLLLEGHASKKVFDAFIDAERSILVG